MRINTLTFDANLPTTQQVNVPTNTDYKVGLKVKRNGEVQQLGPDEITIYTGEITPGDTTVVGPADSPSNLERTVNGTNKTTIFMMFPKASLSAYADKYIAPSDIEQTWHLSGETTATPLEYGDLDIGYGVQYVEGSTVWYSYKGKWCRIAGGEIAERKDRVQIIDTALMRQNFNLQTAVAEVFFDGTIPTAGAPILVDSTITFHDADTPVTIPTDADKTNGYVTFTQAAGDDASFRQLSVVVDKSPEYSNTTSADSTVSGQRTSLNISLDLSAFVGMELTPENIKLEYLSGDTYVEVQPAPAQTNTGCYIAVAGSPIAFWQDGKFWAYDTDWYSFDTLTLPEGATFSTGGIQGRYTTGATITYPATFKASVGDMIVKPGFTANFKLNVNEFKSQCGDINVQTDPDFNTAKVEGTYEDGTEFSFDFCTK